MPMKELHIAVKGLALLKYVFASPHATQLLSPWDSISLMLLNFVALRHGALARPCTLTNDGMPS